MENIGKIIKSPEARKYIYAVVIGAIPLLVTYGLIAESSVDDITLLVGAILGFGATSLAVVNTPSKVDSIDGHIHEVEVLVEDIEGEVVETDVEAIASNAVEELVEVKSMLAEIIERLDEEGLALYEEMGE